MVNLRMLKIDKYENKATLISSLGKLMLIEVNKLWKRELSEKYSLIKKNIWAWNRKIKY